MAFSTAKRVTSLLTFGLAALSADNLVKADQVENPLRLKFNSDVLKALFHKGDQRMLDVLQDLTIGPTDKEPEYAEAFQANFAQCPTFKSGVYSVTVEEGQSKHDFDFDVSFGGEDQFMGFEGRGLRAIGQATFESDDGSLRELSFSGPITKFKLETEFVAEDNKDIIEINKRATKPTVKDFSIDIGQLVFEGGESVSDEC